MKKLYVLYDERAHINEDDAMVLCTADSLAEACTDRRELFPGAVIFEYEQQDGKLCNGRIVA